MRCSRFLFIILCGGICIGAQRASPCALPTYKVIEDSINYETGRGTASVTLPVEEFVLPKIACLAESLRSKSPDWRQISILMFRNDMAPASPLDFDDLSAPEAPVAYVLNQSESESLLLVMPLGLRGNGSYDTRAPLSTQDSLHCRVEYSGRCVFRIQRLGDVANGLRAVKPSRVDLTGVISRSGRFSVRQVANASENQEATAPTRNFVESLIIEASQRDAEFAIGVSLVSDPSLPVERPIALEFDLPNQITIKYKPIG